MRFISKLALYFALVIGCLSGTAQTVLNPNSQVDWKKMSGIGTTGNVLTSNGPTVTPSFQPTGAGAGTVQYNTANTNHVFIGDSRIIVASPNTTNATAVSCDGTSCTLTDTQTYRVGQWIQFAANSPWSPSCLNWKLVQVATATGTSFTVTESATGCTGAQTGTGGTVQDGTYFYPQQAGQQPFFIGHGTIHNLGVPGGTAASDVSSYSTVVHPLSPAVTGVPGFLYIQSGQQDILNCAAGSVQASLQSIWASAHADGFYVVMTTLIPTKPSIFCDVITPNVNINAWVRGQSKNHVTEATGQYWDALADISASLNNVSDTALFNSDTTHLTDNGAALFAKLLNNEMASQGSTPPSQFGGITEKPLVSETLTGVAMGQGVFGMSIDPGSGVPYIATGDTTRPMQQWRATDGFGLAFVLNGDEAICFTNAPSNTGADKFTTTPDPCLWRGGPGTFKQGSLSEFNAGTGTALGGGGSMTYPASGLGASTGTAWRPPTYSDVIALFSGCNSSNPYLTYNGTCAAATGGSGMSNPMTTAGDLIIGGTSGAPARLAADTSGKVLTSNGAGVAPSWQTPSGGSGGSCMTPVTTTLGTTSQISLTIPQTCRNLQLFFTGQGTDSSVQDVNVQFNSESGTAYQWARMFEQPNSSFQNGTGTNAHSMLLGKVWNTSQLGQMVCTIPNYTTSLVLHFIMCQNVNSSSVGIQGGSSYGLFSKTPGTALTSIQLTVTTGNFDVGTTVTVYGLP